MSKLRLCLILAFAMALSGCMSYHVSHQDVKDLENPFSTDKFFLYSSLDASDWISIIKWTGGKVWYTLTIEYVGSSWRFMDGEIKVKTDKGLAKYSVKPLRSMAGSFVHETLNYVINTDVIRDIIESSAVLIQYYGEPIQISRDKQAQLARFYKEYVQ